MSALFELEWMGGVAEHHYRKARTGVDGFDWDSLDHASYTPQLLAAARDVWTNLAQSEYAAINWFAQMVSALGLARAPLDLIGMTSDFLADEVRHVELASRMLMQLGGAAPRPFDPQQYSPRVTPGLAPFEHANELALRLGCIAEAFAGGTALQTLRATTHPLIRDVYTSILRDEARHRRFGSLYFEWAGERLDHDERARLGRVACSALEEYAPRWRDVGAAGPAASAPPAPSDTLGWLEAAHYARVAVQVVREEILPSLRDLDLILPEAEIEALLSTP